MFGLLNLWLFTQRSTLDVMFYEQCSVLFLSTQHHK